MMEPIVFNEIGEADINLANKNKRQLALNVTIIIFTEYNQRFQESLEHCDDIMSVHKQIF